MAKNFLIVLQKSTIDAIKTASKTAIQKRAEATGDLIGNKIADEITSISREFHSKKPSNNNNNNEDAELTTHKKRYISPEQRQQIINEWRLVSKKMSIFKNYWWINVNIKNIENLLKKDNKLFIN